MSQENVEVVRQIYDALPGRDAASAFALYADDIVWDISRFHGAFLWTRPVYHGHEGVRQAWREWLSAFGQIDVTVEELIDAGDKVLAVITERETGRASGVPVRATHFAVWTLAGGKAIRLQAFNDRTEALEAAGPRE